MSYVHYDEIAKMCIQCSSIAFYGRPM